MISSQRIAKTMWAFGVLIVCTLAGSSALTQEGIDYPVIVAVPDSFPLQHVPRGHAAAQSPRALVMRFAHASGKQDLIVLHANKTSPELLREALRVLRAHRIRRPAPDHDHVVVIPDMPPGRQRAVDPAALPRTKLTELLARPRARHEKLGQARWIEVANPATLSQ